MAKKTQRTLPIFGIPGEKRFQKSISLSEWHRAVRRPVLAAENTPKISFETGFKVRGKSSEY